MFLRHTKRKKDGKEQRYWSIVENRRIGGGRVVQRPVLYLGDTAAAHAVAVSGGPLRGIAGGRLYRSVAAKRAAVVPAAPVGRMLVGSELVARA
jgi:hypothetical protein